MAKYRNRKAECDGICFDSIKELRRYKTLKQMEEEGKIKNLKRQIKFVLIPSQREPDAIGKRGGIKKGKTIEKECAYISDFCYEENGVLVVEDVKSAITKKNPVFVIKRKLMLYVHGIRIREV